MDVDMVKEGQYFWNVLANSYSEGVDGIQQLLSNELFEFHPLVDRIEVNGDLALIPSSSFDEFASKNEFPISNAFGEFHEDENYVKHRYQQYMKNWKQFVDIVPNCDNTTLEDPMTSDVPCTSDFDLRKYLHDSPEKPKRKAWGAGVKRIDLKARRYIIDNEGVEGSLEEESNDESDVEDLDEDAEEVDVVTISENDGDSLKLLKEETVHFKTTEKQGTSTALEAQDVKTLLEQFEAAEIPDMDSVEQDLKTLTKAPIQFLHNILENAILETKPKTVKVKEEPLDIDEQEANIKSELVDSGFSDASSPVNKKVEGPVKVKKEKRDVKQSKGKLRLDSDSVKNECADVKNECVKENRLSPRVQVKKEKDENVKIKLENSKCATPLYKQKENSSPKYLTKKEFPIKNNCPVKNEYPTKSEYPAKKECPTKNEYPVKKEYPVEKECPLKNEVPRIKQTSTTTSTPHDAKHKQIRDSLPQELIDRIKESRKRKTISIIEPIMPNKKQKVNKSHEQTNKINKHDAAYSSKSPSTFEVPGPSKKLNAISSPYSTPLEAKTDVSQKIISQVNTVYLDHNYAQKFNVYSTCHKKDSGFESTEEEEEQQVIGTQPIVKNADGRMMVSLLKVNTIRTDQAKKRKLNLEEYKKRREGVLKSQNSSQNSSPVSSTCSSPVPEDETVRLQRHQEKLMRMAMEVLNTPAKSDRKQQPVTVTALKPAPKVVVPPNIEKKTMVSVGINTLLQRKNNVDPLAPIEQLEEIRPLLASASNRINSSSLITSMIENIPRIISTCTVAETNVNQVDKPAEHGEDKTIVYLPKDRTQATKSDFAAQTELSLEEDLKKQITRIISSPTSSSSNTDGPSSSSSNNIASPASSSSNNRENSSSASISNRESSSSSSGNSESFSSSSNSTRESPSSSLTSNRERESRSSCRLSVNRSSLSSSSSSIREGPSNSSSSNRESPSRSSGSNRENSSSKRKSRSSSSSSSRESPMSSRYKRRRKSSEHSDYSSRSSSSASSPRYSSGSSYSSRSRSRSRSPSFTSRLSSKARYQSRKIREQERLREVEERRVIYIGGLLPTMTREDLRRLFQKFGHITNVSLHSRDQGDNYGFVTFAKKSDAYEAFEARNIDSCLKHYDISFGGRRIFCQTLYADLDYMPDEMPGYPVHRAPQESFDALLREVQEQMRKRRV